MVILVCGDRNWTDRGKIREDLAKLLKYPNIIIRHGANGYDEDGRPSFNSGKPTVRGADMIAHEEALSLGLGVDPHPADWDTYGKKAGPIRNQEMLGGPVPEFILAFHNDIESSRGTKDMKRRGEKAGIPVYVRTEK